MISMSFHIYLISEESYIFKINQAKIEEGKLGKNQFKIQRQT